MSNHDYRSDPELQSFGDVMDVLNQGPSEVVPEPLPEDLWSRISADIADVPSRDHLIPPTHITAPTPIVDPALNGQSHDMPGVNSQPSNVTQLASRRSSKLTYSAMGIAAAIALLVMVPLAFAWQTSRTAPIDSVAQLDQLEGFTGGEATATLRGTSLELEVAELPEEDDSFYEVWAIDLEGEDIQALTSLGKVEGSAEFDWPEGIDPEEYSVIDISIEPNDGNPKHSGVSVLQGELAEQ